MAIIKADFEGAMRLAEISADELTVFHLRQTLAHAFDKPDLDGFDLHYLDDNDGPVLIDSDEEFLAGLCENGSPFRVSVVPRSAELDPFAFCGASLTEESGLEQPQGADADNLPIANLVLSDEDGEDDDDDEEDEEEDEDVEGESSDPIQHQLFGLATQRIQERSSILKNLAASELQAFMELLQLPLKKLVKADLLSKEEVCPERKRGRFCRRRGGRRQFTALPSGAEQALRNAGLTLSDEQILALVNVLHVQPRRFKKLGLCDADAAAAFAHERESGVGEPRLYELAASRIGVPISAENLAAFMQFLQFPVKRLMKAGLVTQKEFRGTGREALTCTLARDRAAHHIGHHSPKIMQALQEHGLFLEPPVVHHLMTRLAIAPRRFVKLGLIEPCSFRHGSDCGPHPHSHGPRPHCGWSMHEAPPMHTYGHAAAHCPPMHGPRPHFHHQGPHHFGGVHPHHHGPRHFGGMHPHHGAHGPQHFGRPMHAHGMHHWAARAEENDPEQQRFPNNAAMARIITTDHADTKKHAPVGTTFEQRWKVQNMHTFAWPASVQLVSDNDDSIALGVAEPIAITVGAQPEQMVDITVRMTAPLAAGLYRPTFRLRDATTGLAFGQRLRADVLVTSDDHARAYRGKRAGAADY